MSGASQSDEGRAVKALRFIAEHGNHLGVPLCVTCGEIHPWRPNPLFKPDAPWNNVTAGTWASEEDGHSLRRTPSHVYARTVVADCPEATDVA